MNEHSNPDRTTVIVGSLTGYLFAGDGLDILCFVPESLVEFDAEGRAVVDQARYIASGWSQCNVRGSDSETGVAHVFPDSRKLIDRRSVPNLRVQVERWQRLAAADNQA